MRPRRGGSGTRAGRFHDRPPPAPESGCHPMVRRPDALVRPETRGCRRSYPPSDPAGPPDERSHAPEGGRDGDDRRSPAAMARRSAPTGDDDRTHKSHDPPGRRDGAGRRGRSVEAPVDGARTRRADEAAIIAVETIPPIGGILSPSRRDDRTGRSNEQCHDHRGERIVPIAGMPPRPPDSEGGAIGPRGSAGPQGGITPGSVVEERPTRTRSPGHG